MAKGDSKRATTAINQQRAAQTGQQNQIYGEMLPAYVNSRADDQRTRAEIEANYRGFNPNYNIDTILGGSSMQAAPSSSGGGGGGGGSKSGGIQLGKIVGGIDPSLITSMGAKPYEGYEAMSQGLRPEFWADFNKYMGTLDNSIAGYRNFADTGGISEDERVGIRARAIAPVRGMYQNTLNDLERQKSLGNVQNVTGNRLRANREMNQAVSDAALGAETAIAQQTREGKLAGLAGQTSAANMAIQARNAVEQIDQQMRANGLAGMTDIEKSRLTAQLTNQQITQQGQIATNQGILQKAQIEAQNRASGAASSAAAAARADAMRRFEAEMRFNAQQATNRDLLANQSGWTNLYGTTPGATALTGSQLLNAQNMGAGQNNALLNTQIAASQIPSDWSQAMGNIGSTLSLAGSVAAPFAGIPSFGGFKDPDPWRE